MAPLEIPLGYYTHLYFSFVYINPDTFEVAPMSPEVASLYEAFTAAKIKQPGLEAWAAFGGWSFNNADEPTASTFSDLAASESAQETFFASLISFLVRNNFNGVDIDW